MISVRYFGLTASYSGTDKDLLEFDKPVTVKEITDIIFQKRGYRFSSFVWTVLLNGRALSADCWIKTSIEKNSELTILPHLSGG